jgi:hypothetical protein
MIKGKLILGIILVFLVGAFAGAIGTGIYFKYQRPPRITDLKARKAFIMEKLSKELSLTPDQEMKVGSVVAQIEEKRHKYFLQYRSETEKSLDQIRKELDGDQQKTFDAMREKFDWRKRSRPDKRSPKAWNQKF